MSKISIRFYNDREVRAIWDEEKSKWWFSAIDVIRAINDEADYVKAGNYWRWLKKKFTTDGIQLVSVTHDFKFEDLHQQVPQQVLSQKTKILKASNNNTL